MLRVLQISLLFFAFSLVGAQNNTTTTWSFQGAPVLCKQVYSIFPDAGWMVGYSLYTHLGLRFTPELGLDIGLGYVKQGTREDTLLTFYLPQRTLRKMQFFMLQNEYLKVPLLFRYTAPENKTRFYMNLGLQLGILLNSQLFLPEIFFQEIQLKKQTLNATAYYQNVILEFCIGMGLEFRLSENFSLFTEGRFEYGLSDIRKTVVQGTMYQTYVTQEGIKFDRPLTPAVTRNLSLAWHVGFSFRISSY
ncbi:MAG: outer membrane beta-barrel protein [Bacteroidia bacterium]|nr:PorT family protein [Bacteroidia bacterium]MDW8158563.1 outer membrane beta-barrel protein [Bacteroidia bacterium]